MIIIDVARLSAWSVSAEMLDWFNGCFPDGSSAYQDVLDAMAADDCPDFAHRLLDLAGADKDGVLEIDGSAQRIHVFAAGRLLVHGAINIDGWMRAGLTIKADHDVRAGQGIRAGWSIWVGGEIFSNGPIRSSARIDAGVNIEAGKTIWSGCAVTAGGSIRSDESILVGKDDLSDSPWSYHWDADLGEGFRENLISLMPTTEQFGHHDNRCNSLLADCTTIGMKAAGDIAAADCISCATTIHAAENITAGRAILAGRSIVAGDNIIVGRRPFLEWQPCLEEELQADFAPGATSICGKSGIESVSKKHDMLNQDCKTRSAYEHPLIPSEGISVDGDIWCDGKVRGNAIRAGGSLFAARYVAARGDIIVGKALRACERVQGASIFAGWGIESGAQIIVDKKIQFGYMITAESIVSYKDKDPEICRLQSDAEGHDPDHETVCRPLQTGRLDMSDINQPPSPTQKQTELRVFRMKDLTPPTIKVIGVGGAGCNALDYLASQHLEGVELIATNTDEKALARCVVNRKLLLGRDGLAAGGDADVGRRAACDSREEIIEALKGAHLAFIVAGLGGGTGSGAGPVIANIANKLGIYTIGLVTYPFRFEFGRSRNADAGMASLVKEVSSLFTLSHDRLGEVCDADMSMDDAFRVIDQLYGDAIKGVSEILCSPSLVNMSSRQVCTALAGEGSMYSGCACGADRARVATERALSLQLSTGIRVADARSVLLLVTAARGIKQKEVKHVISAARFAVAPGSKLFLGTTYDDTLGDSIRVTVFAVR